MALSPYEVETKQFVTVMRGFDPIEVGVFLRSVAEEMRGLLRALYAAVPPGEVHSALPDPHDLVDHGSAVAAETALLAEAGRSAQLDVAALRRQADLEVQVQQLSATEHRVRAVREANQLLLRAQAEAEAIEAQQGARRQRLLDSLADLEEQLAQGEKMLRQLRTAVSATSAPLRGRTP